MRPPSEFAVAAGARPALKTSLSRWRNSVGAPAATEGLKTGSFYQLGVLFVGITRALLFAVDVGAPDSWKLQVYCESGLKSDGQDPEHTKLLSL